MFIREHCSRSTVDVMLQDTTLHIHYSALWFTIFSWMTTVAKRLDNFHDSSNLLSDTLSVKFIVRVLCQWKLSYNVEHNKYSPVKDGCHGGNGKIMNLSHCFLCFLSLMTELHNVPLFLKCPDKIIMCPIWIICSWSRDSVSLTFLHPSCV